MTKRSNESPMDFEWQTRAPGDVTSPFYQLAMKHEKDNKKRPHNIFDSPSKPSNPSLREPASQSYLFSRPQSSVPFPRHPAFTTPRKLDLDFSSGAENFSSPDHADNDDTPEQPSKSERRNSLFNFYGKFPPSPGRGEIPRSNKFSNVLVKRVHKRRRRDREIDRHIRRPSEDSDEGLNSRKERKPSESSQSNNSNPNTHEIPFFSRFFTFLETHPHIPRILSYYAQFTFNFIIALLTLYIIITFVLAIKSDFDNANEDVSADILAEMSTCAKNYVENRCSGEDGKRLPALEVVCDNWERCMNKDPAKARRVKVSAQTLAEIFNGFIEPISFKTMFFFIASITSCIAVSNLTFSFFRNKSNTPPTPNYRPFTPPPMHSQSSHLAYTSGRPGYGMEGSYFAQTPGHGFNQAIPMGTHREDNGHDSKSQRQIDMGPAPDYQRHEQMGTPSPVKPKRNYM